MASTPVLDITTLDTHNVKIIGIADLSSYPNNFIILNPTVEITPPAFPRVTLPFTYGNLNIFDGNNVGITCNADECNMAELPDGIWKVKYSISPSNRYSVEKSFIRTELIQIKLAKAFLCTDMKECNQDIKEQDLEVIEQIEFYIQGAISDGNTCNPISAMNKYRQADKMLNNFLKSKA